MVGMSDEYRSGIWDSDPDREGAVWRDDWKNKDPDSINPGIVGRIDPATGMSQPYSPYTSPVSGGIADAAGPSSVMESQQPLPVAADFNSLLAEFQAEQRAGAGPGGMVMTGQTFEEWLKQKYGSDISALGGMA